MRIFFPSKVKAFAWLVAHKKATTMTCYYWEDPIKALVLIFAFCVWRMEKWWIIFFLCCPLTLGLWHKLFRIVNLDWVPPRSICDMMTISYKGLGSSMIGIVHWQITCLGFFGLFGKKEMLGSFRTRWGLERLFEISFLSISPFEPLAP